MSRGVTTPKLHWALDRIKREPFFQHNFQVACRPLHYRHQTVTPAASIMEGVYDHMSKGVTAPKLHWALDRIKREPFFQHNFQVGFAATVT
jgi:hypothetical protein